MDFNSSKILSEVSKLAGILNFHSQHSSFHLSGLEDKILASMELYELSRAGVYHV